jgi:hypothetical protein
MSSSDSDDGILSHEIQTNRTPDLSDSEEFFPNPILDDHLINNTQSATDTYKSAIDSLKGHNSRKTTAPLQSTRQSKSTQPMPALVDSEEFIDDWLIDDMQHPTKKQRLDVNGVFSSNSSRKITDENLSRKNLLCSVKKKRNMIIEDEESNNDTDRSFRGSSNHSNQEDVNLIIDEDDVDISIQNNVLSRPLQRSKPRQLSLTNFAVRISETGTNNQEAISGPPNQFSTGLCNAQNITSIPTMPRETAGPVMRVKVRVKDKLLLIPVPSRYVEMS